MEASFWQARWAENKTAFHEGRVNAYLEQYGDRLHGRVLVPLCGKAEDLAWLAGRGHDVVGIELVEDAVRQFFAEHGVEPEVAAQGAMRAYRAGTITLLAGDVFAVTAADVGAIASIYDRAALVALPRDLRDRYAAHLRAIAGGATRELLVSVEYEPGAHEGPPFSVDRTEVLERFADARVEYLGGRADPRGRPMSEHCYDICW
jgi:thiopurine S-methyltransferase